MTEILLIAATSGSGGTTRKMRVARLCLRKRKLSSQPAPDGRRLNGQRRRPLDAVKKKKKHQNNGHGAKEQEGWASKN